MGKNERLFSVFSENLKNNFKRFGLKVQHLESDVLDALYICPISLRCYTIEGSKNRDLTIEHVPPESLGGKGIVLTSKEANNMDGQTMDKKLLNYFKSENFKTGAGEIDVVISSDQLEFNGVKAKFTVGEKNGKPLVKLSSSMQNIKVLDFKGLFENWDGGKFNLKWQQQVNIDKKALLKCAYLTVFSKIGYELIFDSAGLKKGTYGMLIDYLRSSVLEIDFPIVYINQHAPLNNSTVGVITAPSEFATFVVNLTFKLNGNEFKYAVFLPHPDCTNLSNLKKLEELITTGDHTFNFKIAEVMLDICS
ncbi:hypothetical protein CPT03_03305 [Pedobacter ginsengisoli]|uniref:Uncharacterized protein n=1 Tax=Pedobacter ginsengisoli TaxID=363852 RepID=A0A2D1U1S3_9SPHI|nr:hypothetical protein [Pedobacter ginsengisoli]ATP55558.1 hypothetical protein CPT03_03305 [Pedobacter ginsengisoli]